MAKTIIRNTVEPKQYFSNELEEFFYWYNLGYSLELWQTRIALSATGGSQHA